MKICSLGHKIISNLLILAEIACDLLLVWWKSNESDEILVMDIAG